MKKLKRFLWLAGALALLVMGTAICASAATGNIDQNQSSATEKSVTVSWNTISEADYYELSYCKYETYKKYKNEHLIADMPGASTVRVRGTSYTINCAKDSAFMCDVIAFSSAGLKIDQAGYNRPLATVPGKLKKFKVERWNRSKGGFFIMRSNPYPNTMTGVEWKLLTRNGKKIAAQGRVTETLYIEAPAAPTNQVYRLSVRGYTTVNHKKFYGPWYTKTVVPQPMMKELKLVKVNQESKIKVSWRKVAGATKYIVYASTNATKGYKKVGTVKNTKSSLNVSKIYGKPLEKGVEYFFKVRAVRGKVKSTVTNYRSGYIFTSYK